MGLLSEQPAVWIELACLNIAQLALLCLLTAERANLYRNGRKARKLREKGADTP